MDSDEWTDDDASTEASTAEQGQKRRANAPTPTKKKRIRGEMTKDEKKQGPKIFQESWLQGGSEFKAWVKRVPGDNTKARCSACNATLLAGKSELQKHAKGIKHTKNMTAISNIVPINQQIGPSPEMILKKKVKIAEIGLAAFFADCNVAPYNADSLVGTLKHKITDSEIIKRITMDRTKCCALLKNVLGKTEQENVVEDLKIVKFSILVDESTDTGNLKNMVVLTRYTEPKSGQVRVPLLTIIELDAKDCTAANMFAKFEEEMDRLGVPITNIVGLACDHAPVMIGKHNSFASHLRERCPWLVVLDCICHSAHIAASNACSKLPSNAVTFVRRVATYVAGSPKRSAIFEEFQEYYNEQQQHLKLKKVSATRWLVLHPCVVRVLENWVPLSQYFNGVVLEDTRKKDKEAAAILSDFHNPFTKAYLYFLKFILDYFNKVNALFQSERTMLHKLWECSMGLLKQICQNYMRQNVLDSIGTIDLGHPHFQLPLERVSLGPNVEEALSAIPLPDEDAMLNTAAKRTERRAQDIKGFRLRCLEFYVTAAKELQKYLPLDNPLVKEARFLDPAVALSGRERQGEFECLPSLTRHFKDLLGIDSDSLYTEWRNLPYEIPESAKERLMQLAPEEFWQEVAVMVDFANNPKFPNLVKLAQGTLGLPHSNADAERVFSTVTDTKSKKRSIMGVELLTGICVTRVAMRQRKESSQQYKVTDKHLEKHNSTMYK